MTALIVAAILQTSCTQVTDGRFAQTCARKSGLAVERGVGWGGVRSDAFVFDTLWLLFDFNAPFIEYEVFTPADQRWSVLREWAPPSGHTIMRAERVPLGSPQCDVFESWFDRVSRDRRLSHVLKGRWRERRAFGSDCLALTFWTQDQIDAADQEARASGQWRIRHRLTVERAFHRLGGLELDEQRFALTQSDDREFTLTTLTLMSVPIDAPAVIFGSCGDPNQTTLESDGQWFIRDETSEIAEGARLARLHPVRDW